MAAEFSVAQLNALERDAFIAALIGLFEGPPWIVARAEQHRPFADREALYAALCDVMYAASEPEHVALIRAHPDLVGRAALSGTLSPASTAEQSAAGLDRLTPEDIADFTRLNAEYKACFAFPFVICARGNRKESILAGFQARLAHSREEEIQAALGEIAKICRLRLLDTVSDEPATEP